MVSSSDDLPTVTGCFSFKPRCSAVVALHRDRRNSMEETLRLSYAFSDAHAAYLLSLNTIGQAFQRFFDQAVESPPDLESESSSSDLSEVAEQLQEMFKEASEAGNDVLKMIDTLRFRYNKKKSIYQSTSLIQTISNILLTKKMVPKSEEDIGSNLTNITSTLKKILVWEKKLYQEVKAGEKSQTTHMRKYKRLMKLEQKSTDESKIEDIRSQIECLSAETNVSINTIEHIGLTINKLCDQELGVQIKDLIHRLFEMWSSMLECHKKQYNIITNSMKLKNLKLKRNLDMSQFEIIIKFKHELRNWNQRLTNMINAQAQFVKALNSWLMRCLKQEPRDPTPNLSEKLSLVGLINTWSQILERSNHEDEFTESVYSILVCVNREIEKEIIETEEDKSVVVSGLKEMEKRLAMEEKEEEKMLRKMKRVLSVELIESLDLKSNVEKVFESMKILGKDLKKVYEELDLMST